MLQALVMDGLDPDMAMLQKVLEVSGRRGQGAGALGWRRRKEGTRAARAPGAPGARPAACVTDSRLLGSRSSDHSPAYLGGCTRVAVTA